MSLRCPPPCPPPPPPPPPPAGPYPRPRGQLIMRPGVSYHSVICELDSTKWSVARARAIIILCTSSLVSEQNSNAPWCIMRFQRTRTFCKQRVLLIMHCLFEVKHSKFWFGSLSRNYLLFDFKIPKTAIDICLLCVAVLLASMAEWLRVWDTLAMMKLWRREVVSSILDRGTIVWWVFSPARQLVRFSHLNMPSYQNTEIIWNIVPVGKQ